jgi:hypothetical protein
MLSNILFKNIRKTVADMQIRRKVWGKKMSITPGQEGSSITNKSNPR